jgi:hypothetical protein
MKEPLNETKKRNWSLFGRNHQKWNGFATLRENRAKGERQK